MKKNNTSPVISDKTTDLPNVGGGVGSRRDWRPAGGWIFLGFLAAYLLFLVYPVFLNGEHVFKEVIPIFKLDMVGVDIIQIRGFSENWFVKHGSPYVYGNSYPPLEALLFVPFLFLDLYPAYVLITMLTIICYLGCSLGLPYLMTRRRPLSATAMLIAAAGLFSHGLIFELDRGQFNMIAMAFCLWAIYLFHTRPGQRIPAYVLFTLSCQLKVYPAIFILMLVDDWRDWRAILKRFALLAAANFLCLFVLGPGAFFEFLKATKEKMNSTMKGTVNHSISSYSDLMNKVHHWPATPLVIGLLVVVAILMIAVLAVSIVRAHRGFNPYLLMACSIAALVIPAVSWDYSLTFLPIPAILLLGFLRIGDEGAFVFRAGRRLAVLLIAFAYFSTCFSVNNRFDICDTIFANNAPLLILLLAGTLWLFVSKNIEWDIPGEGD